MKESTPTNSPQPPSPTAASEVRLEDGILYFHYNDDLTADLISSTCQRGLELLNQRQISMVPVISTMAPEARIKIGLSQLGKVINTALIKRTSTVIVVNAHSSAKRYINLLGKWFLNNRIITVKTLDEAKLEARKFLSEKRAILEHK